MRVVHFDTETHLLKRGQMMPRMVCLSWTERRPESFEWGHAADAIACDYGLTGEKDGLSFGLLLRERGIEWLRLHLADDDVTLVGANIAYDFGVAIASAPADEQFELLRLVFEKYEKGLVRDIQTRQKLIDIATGEMKFHVDEDTNEPVKTHYHLDELSRRLLKKFLKKKDTWRLRYAELDDVPLVQWPEDAIKYAVDDAITTAKCYEKQDEIAGGPIPNSDEQHRAEWGLHLMSSWGLRTDGEAVAKLRGELLAEFTEMMTALRPSGLLNITPARTLKSGPRKGMPVPEKVARYMKAIYERVADAYMKKGSPCPRTETGRVATDRKTLTDSGDPQLVTLADAGKVSKLLTTYIPILESGTVVPINPRYNILVETGRTSASKPNIQNPPRKGGIRECFIPRDGWVFAFSDYDTLELRALAQCCLDLLGRSKMAEALRRGEDLHLSLAAQMLGISLEEAQRRFDAGDAEIKEYRQQAKPANFGFPGGMAWKSFKEYAEGYGIFLSDEAAKNLHATWFSLWTEMHDYFDLVQSLLDQNNGTVVQLQSGRVRGNVTFCAAANGFFQGRAADGAKEAIWRVARECYIDKSSPLFGCRPVLFLHDEIGIEIPYRRWGAKRSAAAAERLGTVMIEAMRVWIKDVPISCKPIMVRRWFKGADPVKVDGVLVPSKPVTTEKNGKKKTVWVPDLEDERIAA